MKLSNTDRLIIADLFKTSKGLFIFTLHRRYNLSPKVLFEAIKKLEESKIIEITDDRISLTEEGIKYAILKINRGNTEVKKKELIQENFLGPKIGINSFYIPMGFE